MVLLISIIFIYTTFIISRICGIGNVFVCVCVPVWVFVFVCLSVCVSVWAITFE